LGYPVYPVAAPQHLFCRYRLPDGTEQNIEATAGGWSSDEDYIRDLEIPAQGIKSGAYMETMTYRQLLGDLIAENGSYWARQRDCIRAIKYYTLALRLNPKAAEVWRMQGYAYRQLANEYTIMETDLPQLSHPTLEATRGFYTAQVFRYQRAAAKALTTAKELGVAPPLQANYWVRQKELA
jgi:regulator of sirC expression with transglutaminase-like and TPR domain